MKFKWTYLIIFCILIFQSCDFGVKPANTIPTANELLQDKNVLISDLEMQTSNLGILAYHDGTPYSGVAYTFYPDGTQQTKQTYVNGKKEGEWSIWYESGNTQKEGLLKNGKQYGVYREYYSNGNMSCEYEYDLDLKSGTWKGWREDGTQYTLKEFKNDTLDGKLFVFDEDGKAIVESKFVKNKVIKEAKKK